MGEATPAQSAAGPFTPTLAMGLGSAPVVAARGSAVPQLHNAIVERLRARIELCRRHHSTCENRYQRGQAESSDREHENTLHLLNIVHQGPGNRKTKGSRGSNQHPPPEYSRVTAEQKGSEGEQKVSTRIALQGSLRRKIEGHAPGQTSKQNGLPCGFSTMDFKRVRLDTGLGQNLCNHNMNQPLPGPSLGMQRMMPHRVGSDIFNMTLKEMKKEPMETVSCGQSNTDLIFDFKDFKDEGGGHIDPELQDLFDELTKSVPPLNDLEFEKMLKQDDTFGLDLGRPSSAGVAGTMCTPLDRPIKLEHSPDFGQVHGGSPQLRPASAGPSFTLSGTSPPGTSQKANSQVGPPRAMPCWPEISHAEQLKQMAANQQQPSSLLHPQTPGTGLTSWASPVSTHSSSSSFSQDKVPSPLNSQRGVSQSKGINNCLFKSTGPHQTDMKMLNIKPTLHFNLKSGSQSIISPMHKTSSQAPQQQAASPNQSQTHSGLHFQDHITRGLCGPPKSSPPQGGLPLKPSQQRQAVPPCPKLHVNGSLGVMGGLSQPRPSVLNNNQQKGPVKSQPMQRQITPQQHLNNPDKDSAHEQFSRHLTRPPPEYKQPRGMVGLHRGNIFTGQTSTQATSNGPSNDLQPMSCHPQISASPSDDRFGTSCLPTSCISQFPQNNNENRIGLSQNKPHYLGINTQGNSFGLNNVQHGRGPSEMHSTPSMSNVNVGWGSANKQVTSGMRRLPNPLHPQSGQLDVPNLPYQQRHLGPPNQVAPDMGMLRVNPNIRDTGLPRPNQSIMSSQPINRASPEQRVPAGGFGEPSPSSSSFQSNRANQLTFDFLPEGDNTVPGINTDSDFIDSLLKSGSGNDDWMKDINLDEILGSHS